jgi:hypothetical protein
MQILYRTANVEYKKGPEKVGTFDVKTVKYCSYRYSTSHISKLKGDFLVFFFLCTLFNTASSAVGSSDFGIRCCFTIGVIQ